MYIYELPYDINKELCRLLDYDDDWKELAGIHMQYSAFDVNEIELVAKRHVSSPTNQLFKQWGQLNHRVEELFMLLYRMKHIPAMRCLITVVDSRFHRLLEKIDSRSLKGKHLLSSEGNDINRQKTIKVGESSLFPIPAWNALQMPVQKELPKRSQPSAPTPSDDSDSSKNPSTAGKAEGFDAELLRNVSAIPMISYKDLEEATRNWSKENWLGKGGFGQVFKGEWKLLPIAVKRLRDNGTKNRELIAEMCLNKYRHDNILPLYGYSLGGPEACLVYQLMAGGSLEQRLKLKTTHPPLSWSQRYRIAHGVARGLQYLHKMDKSNPLIHGDIKPGNILLDSCTMPKIGDFGLARPGPYGDDRTHLKVSKVHGTRPYLPDDYVQSRNLSPAVDVFSYGVVMVEMATALPVIDSGRQPALNKLSEYIRHVASLGVDFATLEDKVLIATENSNPELCREFVSIGIHCIKHRGQERPTMLDVYLRLDGLDFPGKQLI